MLRLMYRNRLATSFRALASKVSVMTYVFISQVKENTTLHLHTKAIEVKYYKMCLHM